MGSIGNIFQRKIVVILLGVFSLFLIFIFIALHNGHLVDSNIPSKAVPSTPGKFEYVNWEKDREYAIIIDAGSSGSRVMVYSWKLSNSKSDQLIAFQTGTQNEKDWNMKVKLGLSTFGDNSDSTKLNIYLDELSKFASDIIPSNKRKDTPLYLLGTAGLRLLPDSNSTKLLGNVCAHFKKTTEFAIGDCKEHITIIDGQVEGAYGWLSLNYLSKTLTKKGDQSIGFLDMGGASTQIAFLPQAHLKKGDQSVPEEDLFSIKLKTVGGDIWNYEISSTSFLGFGINQAKDHYLKYLEEHSPANSDHIMKDPCFPSGFSLNHNNTSHEGDGDFAKCKEKVRPLLNKQAKCDKKPCLFNGIHLPKFDMNMERFAGVSEYYYTTKDLLNTSGQYDPVQFEAKASEYCKSSWADILDKHEGVKGWEKDNLGDLCFKATWLSVVLHDGFGLNNQKGHFESVNDIDNWEVSWTLGALLSFTSNRSTSQDQKAQELVSRPVSIYRIFIFIGFILVVFMIYTLFNRKKQNYTNPIKIPQRLDDLDYHDEESLVELIASNDSFSDSISSTSTNHNSSENIKRRGLSNNSSEVNLASPSNSRLGNYITNSEPGTRVSSPGIGYRRK